ncbi:MAG: hypothetical protein HC901_03970, partial [Bdellovibrionaceae bacterium]|nr:hypothetical protein [Pseudobdellovibrionaceae bacterium]
MLQAECEGLASCWLGWFNRRAVRRALGLPWRAKIDNLLCLGATGFDHTAPKTAKTVGSNSPLPRLRKRLSSP